MLMKFSFTIAAVLLLPLPPAWAKITCNAPSCPSAETVEAARAIVERECPCAQQTSPKKYKRCAKQALKTARRELGAALTRACIGDVKTAVAQSTCGRPGTVACNTRSKKNTKTTCAIVPEEKCRGSACGAFVSCVDACNPTSQVCAIPTTTTVTTTTLVGGGSTTTSSTSSSTPTTSIGGGSTTSSSATTTLIGGGTTTTPASSTTSTTAPPYSCSITTAACTENSCSCPMDSGTDYHLGATGSVTGPVGTSLRVNINAPAGGTIDCGGWTRVYGATITGCDVIGCCLHESGAPDTVMWSVFEVIDLPCICPPMPPGQHNFLIQCQLNPGPVEEHEQQSTPCP